MKHAVAHKQFEVALAVVVRACDSVRETICGYLEDKMSFIRRAQLWTGVGRGSVIRSM